LRDSIRSVFTAGTVGLLTVSIVHETVDGMPCRTITLSYPYSPSLAQFSAFAVTMSVVRRTPEI
jgi:hypothetical protein